MYSLQTSWLKWKPDYDNAADKFMKAGEYNICKNFQLQTLLEKVTKLKLKLKLKLKSKLKLVEVEPFILLFFDQVQHLKLANLIIKRKTHF